MWLHFSQTKLLRQSIKHFQRKKFSFLLQHTTFSVKEIENSLWKTLYIFKGFKVKKFEEKYWFKNMSKISLVGLSACRYSLWLRIALRLRSRFIFWLYIGMVEPYNISVVWKYLIDCLSNIVWLESSHIKLLVFFFVGILLVLI